MIAGSYRGHLVASALVDLFRSILPDDVGVLDGPRRGKLSAKRLVLVGWDEYSPYHMVAQRGESDLNGRMAETGEIACYIATRVGSGDMAEARERAVELLTAIEYAIREDRGLGGACDETDMGPDMALQQFQTGQDGASVALPFSIAYTAYI